MEGHAGHTMTDMPDHQHMPDHDMPDHDMPSSCSMNVKRNIKNLCSFKNKKNADSIIVDAIQLASKRCVCSI